MNATPETNHAPQSYTAPADRAKVLVGIHADGHVEVFAERNVSVCVRNMPTVPDVSPENRARAEILSQQWFEDNLPAWAKALYWPVNVRGRGNVQAITPDSIALRNWLIGILKGLDRRDQSRSQRETVTC